MSLSEQRQNTRTTRELVRELNAILEQLERKEVEQIFISRKGKPAAVLMSVEHYDEITEK
jgi:prevent-host-death family protein